MKTFKTDVDTTSREAMIAFLTGHFRYHTMNSWNRGTSYANCLKIDRIGLPYKTVMKGLDILGFEEIQNDFRTLIDEWGESNQWRWQAGFNGRSGGYLVLYQGGLDYTNAATARCYHCGNTTYHKVDTPCTTGWCEGTLRVLEKPLPKIITYPGKSVDQDNDFSEFDDDELRTRVELIQSFDELCDKIVATFVNWCDNHEVVEEEVMVPKTVRTLVEREVSE